MATRPAARTAVAPLDVPGAESAVLDVGAEEASPTQARRIAEHLLDTL